MSEYTSSCEVDHTYVPFVSEDLYSELRTSLIERLDDKESVVRAQAILALSKLVGCEDPQEIQDDEQPIVMYLLDSLCYDHAA